MIKIKPEEITRIITRQLQTFSKPKNVGTVLQIGDGIARIYGLEEAMAGELLKFEGGTVGIALNLEYNNVGAVLMGESRGIREGTSVEATGKIAEVPVGLKFLGRIVNALAIPIDGQGDICAAETRLVEGLAPGIIARRSVFEPLQTGILSIDAIIPIGRGQRELVIGDRQTGKTAVVIDTILNQKTEDQQSKNGDRVNRCSVKCIYVAIGQKASAIAQVFNTLKERKAMDYSVIVAATADRPSTLQYLAPYTGAAIAEHFMYCGLHTLIVYDDLSKHAQAYREMSLLLRRPPGREAYPGDIFYVHSRLLERAARLSEELGGGSITALPIVETQARDVSAYIPTNVISITDGQIFLSADLFNSGLRPAVDVGISVSRVGSAAQKKSMKHVARKIKLELAQFAELEAFAQFASDLDPRTQRQLARGRRLREMLKQRQNSPLPVGDMVVIIFARTNGHLDQFGVSESQSELQSILRKIKTVFPTVDFFSCGVKQLTELGTLLANKLSFGHELAVN